MFNFKTQEYPEACVIYLTGELNDSSHIVLSRIVDKQFQSNSPSVILDFSEVNILTSTAQKIILDLYLKSRAISIENGILLCGLNEKIQWLVEMTGLVKLVPVFPSLELALHFIIPSSSDSF